MDRHQTKYILLAHRGITDDYPENTLEALSEIINIPNYNKKIIYGIEFDIRLTKDNKIICFHDETTKRLTNLNYTIKNTDYSVLQNLFILDKYKIPLLEDVLQKLADCNIFFNIEIKSKNLSDKKKQILLNNMIDLIKKYKIVDNTFVTSFDHNILNLIISDINIGYLYDGFDNKCLNDNCQLLCFNINLINDIGDTNIKLIKKNKLLGCYTIFEKNQNTNTDFIQYIIDYEIDLIITDNIYKLIDIIKIDILK